MLNVTYEFDVSVYSYGRGTKLDFLDSAIKEFSNKYLIHENNFSLLNMEELKLSEKKIRILGYIIYFIRTNLGKVNFNYPLNFLAAILGREPYIYELEYFIRNRHPDIWTHLYRIKNHPDKIEETGYSNYLECLKSVCKFQTLDENEIGIMNALRKGFFSYNNLNVSDTNFPTMDAFLSNCTIDRESFIKKISFVIRFYKNSTNFNEEMNNFKKSLTTFILSISEKELQILLKNWSGSSNIMNEDYFVIVTDGIENIDIKFVTCVKEMIINSSFINNLEVLYATLISPINSIIN